MVNRDWLRTRVNLLRRSKKRLSQLLGPEPSEIKAYSYEYHLELSRAWTQAKVSDLMAAIEAAEVVYGADFHGYAQAQRTHLRILRQVATRQVTLAMEVFAFEDQKALDLFMAGELEESRFLSQIHWQQRWGVPWEHYRPLVQLAKLNGWDIVALDCRSRGREESFETRDIEAALKIRECRQKWMGTTHLLYVIFGDLHLAEKHLPQKVSNLTTAPLNSVIIYQNAEEIYFELVEQGVEATTDVVALGSRKFCVMSSPPWVQWQSYLMYLENSLDANIEDADDFEEDHSEEEVRIDYTDYVAQYAEIMATDLGLTIDLSQLSVYASNDENVWDLLKAELDQQNLDLAIQLMEKDRSFHIPSANIFYLSRPSVNHASYLAALFIFSQSNNIRRVLWNFPDDLNRLIWREGLAFFLSKLINHKRIAVSISEIHRQLATINEMETREILQLVVEQRMVDLLYIEKREVRKLTFAPQRLVAYIEAARQLGAITGERMYNAFRKGDITSANIVDWLKMDLDGPGFLALYLDLLLRLENYSQYPDKSERM